jgi:hypothetical protein
MKRRQLAAALVGVIAASLGLLAPADTATADKTPDSLKH